MGLKQNGLGNNSNKGVTFQNSRTQSNTEKESSKKIYALILIHTKLLNKHEAITKTDGLLRNTCKLLGK